MKIVRAYLRRDWLIFTSYRFGVLASFGGVTVLVGLLYTIGGAVGHPQLAGHGGDYIAFIVAGLAFTDTFMTGFTVLPRAVRDGQLSGTLEPVLVTPIRSWQLIASSGVFPFIQSLARTLVVLALAVFSFGYYHHTNVLAAFGVFLPSCFVFAGLGMVAAALVMLLKQSDAIVLGYAALSGMLGGALFPTTMLPRWIRPLTILLPLSRALTGIRLALNGASLTQVLPTIGQLSALTAVLVPAGLFAFAGALRRAKKEGSLVQY